MAKKEIKVISLGGSVVIPKTGFDIAFLKRFKTLIAGRVKKGERFILVVGGGATCRAYQKAAGAAAKHTDAELDRLGVTVTHLNAHFVRLLLGDLAYKDIIINPTKKIKTAKPVIVAGGWKPGCSTDRDAVIMAKVYGAKHLINASNINFVYTADPKTNPSAEPISKMSWKRMREIVGNKWKPGANLPFDPLAVKEAQKQKMKVYFIKGTKLAELDKALDAKKINGTIVE